MCRIFKPFCVLVAAAFIIDSVENRLALKLRDINCTAVDADYCRFPTCEIKAVKRDVSEVNVRVTLLKKPIDNITLEAFILRRGYEHEKPLLEYKIDGCAFFRNKRRNPFANIMYHVIGLPKYSNMNHSCPYDHDLIMEGYRFEESYANMLPLKTGHYALHTIWHAYNVVRAHVTIKFVYVNE